MDSTDQVATTTDVTPGAGAPPADTDGWWRELCGTVDRRAKRRLRTLGRERVYLRGETILSEGTRADRFSLILDGEVEIDIEGAVVTTLRADEFFGEIAMLYARPGGSQPAPSVLPRTATVRASETTRVREFDRAEFVTLMDLSPHAAARISRSAVGRLAVLNQRSTAAS